MAGNKKHKKKHKKRNLLEIIPAEIIMEILKYLNFDTISKLMCTSKVMKNAILNMPAHALFHKPIKYSEIHQGANKIYNEILTWQLQEKEISQRIDKFNRIKKYFDELEGQETILLGSLSIFGLLMFAHLFLIINQGYISYKLMASAITSFAIGASTLLPPINPIIINSISFFQKKEEANLKQAKLNRECCEIELSALKQMHNPNP